MLGMLSTYLDTPSHSKDINYRIHIIAAYAVHARPLLCQVASPNNESIYEACLHVPYMSCPQASKQKLQYPRHLLLTYGWYVQEWWLVEDQNLPCTVQERENVLNRSLTFLQFDFIEDQPNMNTDTGIVRPPFCLFTFHTVHTVM